MHKGGGASFSLGKGVVISESTSYFCEPLLEIMTPPTYKVEETMSILKGPQFILVGAIS